MGGWGEWGCGVTAGRPGTVAVTVSVSRSRHGGVESGPQCLRERSAAHVDDRARATCDQRPARMHGQWLVHVGVARAVGSPATPLTSYLGPSIAATKVAGFERLRFLIFRKISKDSRRRDPWFICFWQEKRGQEFPHRPAYFPGK
jgi:hypothetical protein